MGRFRLTNRDVLDSKVLNAYPGQNERLTIGTDPLNKFLNKRVKDINPNWINFNKEGTVVGLDLFEDEIYWKEEKTGAIMKDKVDELEIL